MSEAHVHDSEDASVKGSLDDKFEVLGMDGFVVVDVVSCSVMVFGDAIGDLVKGGA